MAQSESLRVFCAVEIPVGVKRLIGDYADLLRSQVPDSAARWERTEKLHVTLKFFGDVRPRQIEGLSRAVMRAAESVPPFGLAVEGTGVFPPRGAARVFWLGVRDDSGSLNNLRRALEDECAGAGFPREPRPFHPHLTIARLRTPHGAREVARAHTQNNFGSETFTVAALVVMRSELGAGGSKYTPLSFHHFGDKKPD